MSFTLPNGSQYDLILLDTNVLSEVSKNINNTRNSFINLFPPNKYAPCFSPYNLFEIHNADGAYKSFLEFFSIYPCSILHPYMNIVSEEIRYYKTDRKPDIILNSFTPFGENDTYNLKIWNNNLWANRSLVNLINQNAVEYPEIAVEWQRQRKNTELIYTKDFENGCIRNFLFSINQMWTIENSDFDISEFPGARMMLFSQFMRVHKSKKVLGVNDVNDVMISSALPYLDAIITEKSQAEVIKQAKNKIHQLKNIKVTTLSELRNYK